MIETIIFIAFVAIELVIMGSHSDSNCVVTLNGDVIAEGVERNASNGYRFCAYTGIRYAQPPVGMNRFLLPQKIPVWRGTKQFTEEANVCVQMSYKTLEVIGSEDCLFLNIYTSMNRDETTSASDLLPVLFWIHGGSFNVGSADSDMNRPDFFLEKEILVVTINYRLGPLGFLSHSGVTGNIGLHDQRMALEWIHENILYFGGNRSRITLTGWSSGSAAVSYHMYANKSKNLFDKAIMMSGNMLNPWAFESDVARCSYELLTQLNIQNSPDVVGDLKAVDAYDLIPPVFLDELKTNFFGLQQFCFVPTLDHEFVPQSPHFISRYHYPSNVPILIGTTTLESEWVMSFEASNFKYQNENQLIPNTIGQFMSLVFDHGPDTIEMRRFVQNFQHISTMSYGIYKFVQTYVDLTKQENVFLYRFAFDNRLDDSNSTTVHGDELKYLFRDNFLDDKIIDLSNEVLMKQRMVTMWSNFIKFGNPTPNIDDLLANTIWPSFNTEEKLFLNIDYDMAVETLSDNDGAFQLWDSIYQCLYYVECDELTEYLFNKKSIDFGNWVRFVIRFKDYQTIG